MEWIFPLRIGSVFWWSGLLMVGGLLMHRFSMRVFSRGMAVMYAGAVLFLAELFALALRGGMVSILEMSSYVFSEETPWHVYGVSFWSGDVYLVGCLLLLVRVVTVR